MTKVEALQFLKNYRQFCQAGLSIADYSDDAIELDGWGTERRWLTDDEAAELIALRFERLGKLL